jgi:rubrerythrin
MNPSHAAADASTALTGPAARRPVPFALTPKAHAALTPQPDHPPVTLWRHVATLVAWLDAANPRTDHEIACRVMKLAEETGEAVAAYIGMTGQNPRKGTCATRDDLASELCDVIITAMVALATIAADAADAETVLQTHLAARFARLLARIDQPPGEGEWACSCCDLACFGSEPGNRLCPDCASGRCGGCREAPVTRAGR